MTIQDQEISATLARIETHVENIREWIQIHGRETDEMEARVKNLERRQSERDGARGALAFICSAIGGLVVLIFDYAFRTLGGHKP